MMLQLNNMQFSTPEAASSADVALTLRGVRFFISSFPPPESGVMNRTPGLLKPLGRLGTFFQQTTLDRPQGAVTPLRFATRQRVDSAIYGGMSQSTRGVSPVKSAAVKSAVGALFSERVFAVLKNRSVKAKHSHKQSGCHGECVSGTAGANPAHCTFLFGVASCL